MYIYKITNLINNRIYIGQTTKRVEQRLSKHVSEAKCEIKGLRPNNFFHNSLNKYGEENFIIEILEEVSTLDQLNEREDYWIKYLGSTDKSIGYNLMSGGRSGKKTKDTTRKISIKKRDNWKDEELAIRMKNGLGKATLKWQQVCKDNRVNVTCPICGKKVSLPKREAEQRIYCSRKCASVVNLTQATKAASEANSKKALINRSNFRKDIEKWSLSNRELILNCPKNRISTQLKEIEVIAQKYRIYDWRTISNAVSGKESRKDLLIYLQNIIENVC